MPCNPSYFRKKFKEEIASVQGVRALTPHSCRHTYVSQMQALGVDLATIQSLVGHADVDMTKHYLHVQDPVRLNAIEMFDNPYTKICEHFHDAAVVRKRRILQHRQILHQPIVDNVFHDLIHKVNLIAVKRSII